MVYLERDKISYSTTKSTIAQSLIFSNWIEGVYTNFVLDSEGISSFEIKIEEIWDMKEIRML